MIPKTFVDELLQRIDIVSLIGRYVSLRKVGANYSGLCPFHQERTPSFVVSPAKQLYHCFGCGAAGSAIRFLIEHTGQPFPEAVSTLAASAGLVVPTSVDAQQETQRFVRLQSLFKLLAASAQFYQKSLESNPRCQSYLRARGISGQIIQRYGLGCSPPDWNGLKALEDSFSESDFLASGLVKIAHQGQRRYDLFRNRLMFPILDTRGRAVGFGGRLLVSGEPKYLNSPETELFKKGEMLYGLFQARRAIADAGFAWVVEGYMDVISLAQKGIENAVAVLGTACTGVQIQALLQVTKRIFFCFDGDAAGSKAAWKAVENILPQIKDDTSFYFAQLPSGEDPDSWIRGHGTAAWEAQRTRAMPLSEYFLWYLAQDLDLGCAEGKSGLLSKIKPFFKSIKAFAWRMGFVATLARRVGMSERQVYAALGESISSATPLPPRQSSSPKPQTLSQTWQFAGRVLACLLVNPQGARRVNPDWLIGSHVEDRLLADYCMWVQSKTDLTLDSKQVNFWIDCQPYATKLRHLLYMIEECGGSGDADLEATLLQLEARFVRFCIHQVKQESSLNAEGKQRLMQYLKRQEAIKSAIKIVNQ